MEESSTQTRAAPFAPHEILELHELLAMKSHGLMKNKQAIHRISCPELQSLCIASIAALEHDMTEILRFFQSA